MKPAGEALKSMGRPILEGTQKVVKPIHLCSHWLQFLTRAEKHPLYLMNHFPSMFLIEMQFGLHDTHRIGTGRYGLGRLRSMMEITEHTTSNDNDKA